MVVRVIAGEIRLSIQNRCVLEGIHLPCRLGLLSIATCEQEIPKHDDGVP